MRTIEASVILNQRVQRVAIVLNLLAGFVYLAWRYSSSVNLDFWWIAVPLVICETFSYIDGWLFGLTVWRPRRRPQPQVIEGAAVDVFITCYNEPVTLVRRTVRAAYAIRYPHRTYLLDDGSSPAMKAMATEEGAEYIERSLNWADRPRHAKAGNVNNALMQTTGEFILILDADQIPSPIVIDRLIGHFADPRLAFVQSPQSFYNVPPKDPLGSEAHLFYGPILRGKDGWNAAFFCGTNAMIRREALLQMGIAYYVIDLRRQVQVLLRKSNKLVKQSRAQAKGQTPVIDALDAVAAATAEAIRSLKLGASIQEVTWQFQHVVEDLSRVLIAEDLLRMRANLDEIDSAPEFERGPLSSTIGDLGLLGQDFSPLYAFAQIREMLQTLDTGRLDEAQPLMPFATISVTEDFATSMRLHRLGWRSAYHDEVLAQGLAPEDLKSALSQRMRWAQGTMQVMFRENPLSGRGLSPGQRLMYTATMSTYFSGFANAVYLIMPAFFVLFGWLPIRSYSENFWILFLPYWLLNHVVVRVAAGRLPLWRGQCFQLALFPLWIQASVDAARATLFRRPLSFSVTPKTRQAAKSFSLIRIQLFVIALLAGSVGVGLVRIINGDPRRWPLSINLAWASYSIVTLWVIVQAALYDRSSKPTPASALRSSTPVRE